MSEPTLKDALNGHVLIMRCDKGFYPIAALPDEDMHKQAADHGRLNDHVNSIEDINGNVLWQRIKQ